MSPDDRNLFAPDALPRLRAAVAELSYLLGRGYSPLAALKLVGDRHQLHERARRAVLSASCGDAARADRRKRRVPLPSIAGRPVAVDGFNVLITIETALAGGLLLRGRDGALRDLAGVHGGYRPGPQTDAAIALLGAALAFAAVVRIFLDRPVPKSGALRATLAARAAQAGWRWEVHVVDAVDRALSADSGWVVASADAAVLDRSAAWLGLPDAALEAGGLHPPVVDLDGG